MTLFFLYLLKLSISLSAVWLFYQLVLRRLTFYSWNRWYLLGYTALAFFIPAVNVARILKGRHFVPAEILSYIPAIGDPRQAQVAMPVAGSGYFPGFGSWDLLLAVLILGSVILLIRLSARWISLRRLRQRATLIGNMGAANMRIGETKIYQVDGEIVPFSFGDAIYVNRQQHTEKEWEEIILHEYVHIRQRHTLDILLAEGICVLNWYNPFAWLIRQSIRQNLEFIADSVVLENGHDKKGYQYHLLKVIGESPYRLANNFSFSSLKKRIIMMNKMKSARLHLVKFLFMLPLLAVLLVAFRNRHEAMQANAIPSARKTANAALLTNVTSLTGLAPSAAPARDSMPPDANARKSGSIRPAPMGLQHPLMPSHPDSLHPPLFFVDGVESVDGKDPQWGVLNKLNSHDIDHIDVFGPDSARKTYGEKGKNGAVFIYMKKKKMIRDSVMILNASKDSVGVTVNENFQVTGTAGKAASTKPGSGSLKAADSYKGLILLDGNEISKQALNSLDASKIKSYYIVSGDVAVKQYGGKARDGVIVIVSK
jgi:hypothetical protein